MTQPKKSKNRRKKGYSAVISKQRIFPIIALSLVILGGCGKSDPNEVYRMDRNLIGLRSAKLCERVLLESGSDKARKLGDRIPGLPDFGEEAETKRAITQYDTIDRPIIVNALRSLVEYDLNKRDFSKQVKFIINDDKFESYVDNALVQLGDGVPQDALLISKLRDTPPYVPEDMKSYFSSAVNKLMDATKTRADMYRIMYDAYSNIHEVSDLNQNTIDKLQANMEKSLLRTEELVSVVVPYIDEMDVRTNDLREQIGEKRKAYPYVISKDGYSDLSHISEREPVADFVEFQETKYGGYEVAIINKDKVGQDLTVNSILDEAEREKLNKAGEPDTETDGEPDTETDGEPNTETDGEPNTETDGEPDKESNE